MEPQGQRSNSPPPHGFQTQVDNKMRMNTFLGTICGQDARLQSSAIVPAVAYPLHKEIQQDINC